MTLEADLALLRTSVGAAVVPRDVVRVHGPEAVAYLQGQLSQDVAAMAVGASAPTFVLQPQGKVDVWMRASRIADDAFLFDTDPGWGERLIERLTRFKLRTKADIEPLAWSMVVVRGPDASLPSADVDEVVVGVVGSPGGYDVLGPGPTIPDGVAEVDCLALEVLRIEAGAPRMGAEIDETTIPAETGVVDASVSFTKGCYTGQELVARVDSRGGRAPRRIVRVSLPASALPASTVPAVGTSLRHDGTEVGRLTSVAPDGGGVVALALLARSVDTPCTVDVDGFGPASVEALGATPTP